MINISYVAAYDPYHAKFRFLVLRDAISLRMAVEAARILDFYLCFPYRLSDFRASRDVVGQIKAHNSLKKHFHLNTYDSKVDARTLFQRMRPAQLAAMNSLAAQGFLEGQELAAGHFAPTKRVPEEPLLGVLRQFEEVHSDLVDFLSTLASMPLNGSSGLKARSTLEEHRYDNV